MIDYFYDYVKNLIIFLVFMSFIQIIMPSNKFKSYINLVFGIMLIYVMIKPINNIYKSIGEIESLNVFNSYSEDTENIEDYSKYEEIQNEMIEQAFNKNVKLQIENMLDDKYIIKNLNIDIANNEKKELSLSKIELSLIKQNNIVYVKPFNVSEDGEIEDIKKMISSFYNLPKGNIFIEIA